MADDIKRATGNGGETHQQASGDAVITTNHGVPALPKAALTWCPAISFRERSHQGSDQPLLHQHKADLVS